MRSIVVFFLLLILAACGSAPKDYSSAKELAPIDTRLSVASLWVKRTGTVPHYAHSQLPLVAVDSKLYVANVGGNISLLDTKNGEVIWSTSLNENLTSGLGISEHLIFVGSRKAEIVALERNTGVERWRVSATSEMLALPLVSGNLLYVQTIDGKMTALDTDTGKIIWSYSHDIPKLTLRGTASPILDGNQIIAGFANGKLVSLNAQTGEVNWQAAITVPRGRTDLERLSDIDGLFHASNGSVYVTSYQGRVASVSAADGTIQWARKMSSYNGLTVSAGQIYISDAEGQVWSLDARTGATLWRQDNLTGRKISSPVIIENAVVVADYDGYVHWLAVEDGQFIARQSMDEVWNEANEPDYGFFSDDIVTEGFPRLVTVSPYAMSNTLFVRDNTGALAAFQVKSKAQ